MAKGFSEEEKKAINEKLLDTAEECWSIYGYKKSTVDELVKRVGISKGGFYLFYPSKELLFFKVLERIDRRVKTKVFDTLQASTDPPKQKFISAIHAIFSEIEKNPWILDLQNGVYEQILKKLPENEIKSHLIKDQDDISILLEHFNIKCDSGFVSSALKTIFFTLLHKNEIGHNHFDGVIRFLIESLANTLFNGGKHDENHL
ncbi:TetR/AcrR family transcriptional regulator [Bacillus sp. S/N-304-OC-R1]|uniref:TetR/AcrR family transcriptional regulator n=1 Tax=Bacillus sp. S/N-304-OC-R1 TaxID=2758034 RepID=UPI001C8CFBAB|nr:TetR/AcrR family transcriptional regulator [Bacillus sp. S/N-304-OC-R1]MBY0121766.1 TetR/AcrR family transcriptional regulator [Bacillus sp. S/N-304-OC-R1]